MRGVHIELQKSLRVRTCENANDCRQLFSVSASPLISLICLWFGVMKRLSNIYKHIFFRDLGQRDLKISAKFLCV